MTSLDGALALVTGASSGIGRATALALSREGARLVLSGRDEGRLREVGAATGGTVVVADLSRPEGLHSLVEHVRAQPPDVVVHAAGVGRFAPAAAEAAESAEALFAVNLLAPILLTAAVLPGMRDRGHGHLVFVTSIAGALGVAGESTYAASKGGLAAYAASVRAETSGWGVVTTTVVPGVVDTDFFERRGAAYDRRFPRPLPPGRMAAEIVTAIRRDRAEVVLPRWLRLPIGVRAVAPGLYARLAGRFG